MRPGGFVLTERMLQMASFPPGARLLDIGCGNGSTVRLLRSRGFDAMGVDLSPAGTSPFLMQSAAHSLPVKNGLDGILCECSFSLFETPENTLKEFQRKLKPGGMLLISDLYSQHIPVPLQGSAKRLYTETDLCAIIAAQGFSLRIFEDHKNALKQYLAQLIMDQGRDSLYEHLSIDIQGARMIALSYFIMIAQRDP